MLPVLFCCCPCRSHFPIPLPLIVGADGVFQPTQHALRNNHHARWPQCSQMPVLLAKPGPLPRDDFHGHFDRQAIGLG